LNWKLIFTYGLSGTFFSVVVGFAIFFWLPADFEFQCRGIHSSGYFSERWLMGFLAYRRASLKKTSSCENRFRFGFNSSNHHFSTFDTSYPVNL
jgi:hypothetical protein